MYLADKLNCDPMRITKKFSKASYLTKDESTSIQRHDQVPGKSKPDTQTELSELSRLELKFQKRKKKDRKKARQLETTTATSGHSVLSLQDLPMSHRHIEAGWRNEHLPPPLPYDHSNPLQLLLQSLASMTSSLSPQQQPLLQTQPQQQPQQQANEATAISNANDPTQYLFQNITQNIIWLQQQQYQAVGSTLSNQPLKQQNTEIVGSHQVPNTMMLGLPGTVSSFIQASPNANEIQPLPQLHTAPIQPQVPSHEKTTNFRLQIPPLSSQAANSEANT